MLSGSGEEISPAVFHQLGTLQVTVLLVAPPTDNLWSLSIYLHTAIPSPPRLKRSKRNLPLARRSWGKVPCDVIWCAHISVISLLSAHVGPHHSKQASRGILYSKNWPRAAIDFAAPLWDYAHGKENHQRTSYRAPFRTVISPPLSKIIACHPTHTQCSSSCILHREGLKGKFICDAHPSIISEGHAFLHWRYMEASADVSSHLCGLLFISPLSLSLHQTRFCHSNMRTCRLCLVFGRITRHTIGQRSQRLFPVPLSPLWADKKEMHAKEQHKSLLRQG